MCSTPRKSTIIKKTYRKKNIANTSSFSGTTLTSTMNRASQVYERNQLEKERKKKRLGAKETEI